MWATARGGGEQMCSINLPGKCDIRVAHRTDGANAIFTYFGDKTV